MAHAPVCPVVLARLVRACRLAKIAALEQWKVNIKATLVLGWVNGAQRLVPVFKEEVCRTLDNDIVGCRGEHLY